VKKKIRSNQVIFQLQATSIITPYVITGAGYVFPNSCDQLNYVFQSKNKTLTNFPDCATYYSGEDPNKVLLVTAAMRRSGAAAQSALDISFGL
jgi:hypothetical protein